MWANASISVGKHPALAYLNTPTANSGCVSVVQYENALLQRTFPYPRQHGANGGGGQPRNFVWQVPYYETWNSTSVDVQRRTLKTQITLITLLCVNSKRTKNGI